MKIGNLCRCILCASGKRVFNCLHNDIPSKRRKDDRKNHFSLASSMHRHTFHSFNDVAYTWILPQTRCSLMGVARVPFCPLFSSRLEAGKNQVGSLYSVE